MARIKGKAFCAILGIVILVLFARRVYGWIDKVHVLVVLRAIDLIASVDNGLYDEISYPAYRKAIALGAGDEDYVPVINDRERAFNHYYNPDDPPGKRGVKYYYFFHAWGLTGEGHVRPPDSGDYYYSALDWAKRNDTGNQQNWPSAIRTYNYTEKSREIAYIFLGHVGHLLADMSEPDHAANIPHPGSSLSFPTAVEELLGRKAVENLTQATDMDQHEKAVLRDAIQYMQTLVDYPGYRTLNNPFLMLEGMPQIAHVRDVLASWSKLTTVGLERLGDEMVPAGLLNELFEPGAHPEDAKNKNAPVRFSRDAKRIKPRVIGGDVPIPQIFGYKPLDYDNLDIFFDVLARKSKGMAEAADIPLPAGLENIDWILRVGRIAAIAGTTLLNPAVVAHFYSLDDLAEKPIYVVPAIDIHDQRMLDKYKGFTLDVLNAAVDYDAGLFEYFLKIVTPPPYVQKVVLTQNAQNGGAYEAEWHDKTIGKVAQITDSIMESYEIVTDRVLTPGRKAPFIAGKPVSVTIEFGPNKEGVREQIDKQSVEVMIGGSPVSGTLTDFTWKGQFVPSLPRGQTSKQVTVAIVARDIYKHASRDSLQIKGYYLDANPATPALPQPIEPYNWQGYERGCPQDLGFSETEPYFSCDHNHSITIVADSTPESTTRLSGGASGNLDPVAVQDLVRRWKERGATITFRTDTIRLDIRPNGEAIPTASVSFEGVIQDDKTGQITADAMQKFVLSPGSCSDGDCTGPLSVISTNYYVKPPQTSPQVNTIWRALRQDDGSYRFSLPNGHGGGWNEIWYILQGGIKDAGGRAGTVPASDASNVKKTGGFRDAGGTAPTVPASDASNVKKTGGFRDAGGTAPTVPQPIGQTATLTTPEKKTPTATTQVATPSSQPVVQPATSAADPGELEGEWFNCTGTCEPNAEGCRERLKPIVLKCLETRMSASERPDNLWRIRFVKNGNQYSSEGFREIGARAGDSRGAPMILTRTGANTYEGKTYGSAVANGVPTWIPLKGPLVVEGDVARMPGTTLVRAVPFGQAAAPKGQPSPPVSVPVPKTVDPGELRGEWFECDPSGITRWGIESWARGEGAELLNKCLQLRTSRFNGGRDFTVSFSGSGNQYIGTISGALGSMRDMAFRSTGIDSTGKATIYAWGAEMFRVTKTGSNSYEGQELVFMQTRMGLAWFPSRLVVEGDVVTEQGPGPPHLNTHKWVRVTPGGSGQQNRK